MGSKSKEDAEKTISQVMEEYKDEVEFNDEAGEVTINGKPHIPYNKEYWFVTHGEGHPDYGNSPKIETISDKE